LEDLWSKGDAPWQVWTKSLRERKAALLPTNGVHVQVAAAGSII
jgi:hypothetical protein